jgi:hypothetical protein
MKNRMKNRTVHYEWRNKPQEAFGYSFKSKVEYRWACYLEKLKELGAIWEWFYEPTIFEFSERWRKRRIYTPDFGIDDDDGYYYQEVKTSLRQNDITRFRCLAADFPKEKIVLVLFGPENTRNTKQIILRANASKYVERTVFANKLLKKFGI